MDRKDRQSLFDRGHDHRDTTQMPRSRPPRGRRAPSRSSNQPSTISSCASTTRPRARRRTRGTTPRLSAALQVGLDRARRPGSSLSQEEERLRAGCRVAEGGVARPPSPRVEVPLVRRTTRLLLRLEPKSATTDPSGAGHTVRANVPWQPPARRLESREDAALLPLGHAGGSFRPPSRAGQVDDVLRASTVGALAAPPIR